MYSGYGGYSGGGVQVYKSCVHDGTKVTLQSTKKTGITVAGAAGRDISLASPQPRCIVDLAGAFPGFQTKLILDGPPEFLKLNEGLIAPPVYVKVDWPDGCAPWAAGPSFWRGLFAAFPHHGRTVINCVGGHGRTGTALAALCIVAAEMDDIAAIEHVRTSHCKKAVESSDQEYYLEWLYSEVAKEVKDTADGTKEQTT